MHRALFSHLAGLISIFCMLEGAVAQDAAIWPDLKGWSYSEIDAEILEHADRYSASKVYMKLRVLYRKEGAEAVRSAVPALVNRYFSLRSTPRSQRGPGEGHGEFEINLLSFLGELGDSRSESALLVGMRHPNSVAHGLRKLGSSVLPAILDSLSHPEHAMRTGAVFTLRDIAKADPSFFSKEDKELVRQNLVARLEVEEDGVIRWVILQGLEAFGDASIIPILERVAENDPYFDTLKERYRNRALATALVEKFNSTREDSSQ